MKTILSNIRTISGLALGTASLFGGFWSIAAGDTYGIIAVVPMLLAVAVGSFGIRLILKGMAKREKVGTFLLKCYNEMQ